MKHKKRRMKVKKERKIKKSKKMWQKQKESVEGWEEETGRKKERNVISQTEASKGQVKNGVSPFCNNHNEAEPDVRKFVMLDVSVLRL